MTNADFHANVRELLGHATLVATDPLGQAAALIAAATVVIEKDVGQAAAPAALLALIEPTIASWQARKPGEAVQ